MKGLNFQWHEGIPNKYMYFYKKEITEYLFFINNAKLSEVNKLVLLFFKYLEKDKELPKNYFNGLQMRIATWNINSVRLRLG